MPIDLLAQSAALFCPYDAWNTFSIGGFGLPQKVVGGRVV